MEIIKKWLPYIICIGLLVALATTCINSGAGMMDGETAILENQYHRKIEELNKQKVLSERIVDSLHENNNQKDMQIGGLKELNNDLDKKILELSKKQQDGVKVVKKYTYKESAEYISKTYNAEKSVSYDNQSVNLAGDIPQRVVETIMEKDFLSGKLNLTESKLCNTELQLTVTEEKVVNKDKEIKSIVELSQKKDTVIEASKEVIEKQGQNLKKIKRNRFIEHVAIGVTVITGLLLLN